MLTCVTTTESGGGSLYLSTPVGSLGVENRLIRLLLQMQYSRFVVGSLERCPGQAELCYRIKMQLKSLLYTDVAVGERGREGEISIYNIYIYLSLYRAWLLAVSQRRPLQQTLTAFVERAARKYHRSMTGRGNFCKSSAGAGKGLGTNANIRQEREG